MVSGVPLLPAPRRRACCPLGTVVRRLLARGLRNLAGLFEGTRGQPALPSPAERMGLVRGDDLLEVAALGGRMGASCMGALRMGASCTAGPEGLVAPVTSAGAEVALDGPVTEPSPPQVLLHELRGEAELTEPETLRSSGLDQSVTCRRAPHIEVVEAPAGAPPAPAHGALAAPHDRSVRATP